MADVTTDDVSGFDVPPPLNNLEVLAKIKKAQAMVAALCKDRREAGARSWVMSIPARPDHDPDLVIADALHAADQLIGVYRPDAHRAAVARRAEAEEQAKPGWTDRSVGIAIDKALAEHAAAPQAQATRQPCDHRGWIGVDFDGTLAHYDGFRGLDHLGEPVPAMLERVKAWISEGRDVRIFTARGCRGGDEEPLAYAHLRGWCQRHLGRWLPITRTKDMHMHELWDDRAVQVVKNTGRRVDEATPPAAPVVTGEFQAMADEVAKRIATEAEMQRRIEWLETKVKMFDTFASKRACDSVDAAMASRFGDLASEQGAVDRATPPAAPVVTDDLICRAASALRLVAGEADWKVNAELAKRMAAAALAAAHGTT